MSVMPSGVVTFVLAGADPAHPHRVASLLEAAGGAPVASEGSASVHVFHRVSDAVATAAELRTSGVTAPMAIHTGEALNRDGRYGGPAVDRVAQLLELARLGDTLMSQTTAELVADHLPRGVTLLDRAAGRDGERRLRVYELQVATGQLPLPADLADDSVLIGRDAELRALLESWASATAGQRQAVLVAGEPGVGKTYLSSALARHAHAAGASVLFGRCDEDVTAGFQPFVQALRPLARRDDPLLAPLFLEEGSGVGDPESQRFAMFQAVDRLLAGAAAERPVLLVLDDLHWASQATVLLLRHLLLSTTDDRVLVVGTYRDTEVDRSHRLAAVIADAFGSERLSRVSLTGLDRSNVAAYLEAAAGHPLGEDGFTLAAALHRETSGNPFFLREILRHLVERGVLTQGDDGRWTSTLNRDEFRLPDSIREVVERRIDRLGVDARVALEAASVVGARFDLTTIETMLAADCLGPFEQALADGLIVEQPGGFTFVHALVRETLLGGMSVARRVRLHGQVGDVLHATGEGDAEVLAFHFAQAASAGWAEVAIDYALAAAERAVARLAFEDADAHLQRALEATDALPSMAARRSELYLALAELGNVYLLDVDHAHRWALQAADEARRQGDPRLFARAVAGFGMAVIAGRAEPELPPLCEEALGQLGPDEPSLRGAVLETYAGYLASAGGRPDDARVLIDEALALARSTGESDRLLHSLLIRAEVDFGQPDVGQRIALARECVELAEAWRQECPARDRFRTTSAALIAMRIEAVAHLERGDRAKFLEVKREHAVRAEAEASPFEQAMARSFESLVACLDGRFDDAAAARDSMLEFGGYAENLAATFAGQVLGIERERGNLAGLRPLAAEAAKAQESISTFGALVIALDAELGDLDTAADGLDEVLRSGITSYPRDAMWTTTLSMLTVGVATVGDAAAASALADALAPHAGNLVIVGWGVVSSGSVDRYLGMLDTVLGRHDDAERRFEAAVALEERIAAVPMLARTQLWWAKSRASIGDDVRARELASRALATADALGMSTVAADGRALLS